MRPAYGARGPGGNDTHPTLTGQVGYKRGFDGIEIARGRIAMGENQLFQPQPTAMLAVELSQSAPRSVQWVG
jgi:hypothetical protein